MKNWRVSIFWMLWALPGIAETPEVSVARDASVRQTVYAIGSGDCRISWTVHESELNRKVIRHRSDCAWPLAQQAPLLSLLLGKVLQEEGGAGRFTTLTWGRLYGDGAKDATMAARLALAARRAPDRDPRPSSRDLNGGVKKLGRDAQIAAELETVFRDAGLELEISSVEKVLVVTAGSLPFFETLARHGVRRGDRVPYDCMLWFSIRPAEATR